MSRCLLLLLSVGCGASQGQARRVPPPPSFPGAGSFVLVVQNPIEHLDVAEVAASVDGRPLAVNQELRYEGPLAPGRHELELRVTLVGRTNDIFPYQPPYRFEVEAEHSFAQEEGCDLVLHIALREPPHGRPELSVTPASTCGGPIATAASRQGLTTRPAYEG